MRGPGASPAMRRPCSSRHFTASSIDVVVRMALQGEAEVRLGSDPEVTPGSEPTLAEVRWVSLEELQEIELLPAPIKERLMRDAGGGWTPERVYVGSTDG